MLYHLDVFTPNQYSLLLGLLSVLARALPSTLFIFLFLLLLIYSVL